MRNKRACFESHKGGGLVTVIPGDRKTQMPIHGSNQELGKELIQKIKKDLGIYIRPECGSEGMVMATLAYRVLLTPDDNETLLVTCPDLPEVTTFGEDEGDALLRAADAIGEALAYRMAHREDIPAPTDGEGSRVAVPTADALKIRVYQALRESGIRRSELARRLGQHAPQVDRLFDLKHASKIDQLNAALHAIGQQLVFDIAPLERDEDAA